MASGSKDHYRPDAQLADSLTLFTAILGKLHTTIKTVDDVMDSIGENQNTLMTTMADLLATMRSQAMGDSVVLHSHDTGVVNSSGKTIIPAWAGRTGFSVTNYGGTLEGLWVGGSDDYSMAFLKAGGVFINDTYCGAIKVKAPIEESTYSFEEW